MSEHTRTPWVLGVDGVGDIFDADNRSIAKTDAWNVSTHRTPRENRANAAFIVKAVNSHDVLVNALTDARNALASLPMGSLGYASDPMGEQIHWPIRDELLYRIDNALSASIKERA